MEAHTGLNGASPRNYALRRADRLSGDRQFDRVFEKGRRTSGPDVILWSLRREEAPGLPPVRLGVIVSRKLGPAVQRNRIKRLIRESFRLHRKGLREGLDLVVYPRPGCRWQGLKQAEESLIRIWKKAGIVSHE